MSYLDYNVSASLNASVSGIAIAEGMARADVNNAFRQVIADIALFRDDMLLRFSVDLEDYGGGPSKIAAQNSAAFAAAVAALPLGGVIRLARAGAVYKFSPSMTLATANIKLFAQSSTTVKWEVLGASVSGLSVTAAGFECENIKFSGPGVETFYTAGETLVSVTGSNGASKLDGLRFINCKFEDSGAYGLSVKWVKNIVLDGTGGGNSAYINIRFASCDSGRVYGGQIDVLDAVGTAGNAYGIVLDHDSTNYAAGPNQGLPTHPNAFCNDWVVDGLTVIGPKLWQAIDTHGCYNYTATNNRVYAAKFGIAATGGSGSASTYAGWQNIVTNNIIDTRMPDGTASGVVGVYGITMQGGATTANTEIIVSNNIIKGYTTQSINAAVYCKRALITGNIFADWAGVGIFAQVGVNNTAITGNLFGPPSAAGAEAVNMTGSGIFRATLSGNICEAATFTPTIGARLTMDATSRLMIGENMFDVCTSDYTVTTEGTCHGPGRPGVIKRTAVSGAITVDCSLSRIAPGVPLTIEFSALSGAVTSIDLQNAPIGALITLVNYDAASTVTYTRAVSALGGAVNWVGNQDDVLGLMRRGSGANSWTQLYQSANG
jgi:hypothetical protein